MKVTIREVNTPLGYPPYEWFCSACCHQQHSFDSPNSCCGAASTRKERGKQMQRHRRQFHTQRKRRSR